MPVVVALLILFAATQILGLFLKGRWKIKYPIAISKIYSQVFLKVIGARVNSQIKEIPSNAMVVSNHLSWIDPILILSKSPMVFITSTDVKSHSFLGKVTRLAGCSFVNRSPHTLKKEMVELSVIPKSNTKMGFFPEATTGKGLELLPFKSALFNLSFEFETPIQVLCVRYKKIDNEATNENNIDRINYYGGDTFGESFKSILSIKSFEVDVLKGPTLYPKDFENRKELSKKVREEIDALLKG